LKKKPSEAKSRAHSGIPGLAFRNYEGTKDIPMMVKMENACWKSDLIDLVITPEDLKRDLAHPINMNPRKDIIFAEVGGKYAGHSILDWERKPDGRRFYFLYAFVAPKWREKGVREALVRRSEDRIKEIARRHPKTARKFFISYSNAERNDWKSVLEREGYSPDWHLFEMVRQNLDGIPDLPLPRGVEVRPVKKEHLKKIWEAMKTAFKDERSYSEERYGDKAFEKTALSPTFTPELWQIAWAGDEVVGGVHNHINKEENEEFHREWGHTERIFVARAWRKKGVARALIARSLGVLKDQGMKQATLDVDTQNPSGALRVYESLGYRPTMHFTFFKKEFS
jgi:GNAT superfamily N-acetyltransferase